MRKHPDGGGRFLPLPMIATLAFVVLAVGGQYNAPSSLGGYIESRYGPFPNVAAAWAQMQAPRQTMQSDWIIAKDTIASISPVPGPGVERLTVIFLSIQGVPFTMQYSDYYYSNYGDLHPGDRVYAGFSTYYGTGWHLTSVIRTDAAY